MKNTWMFALGSSTHRFQRHQGREKKSKITLMITDYRLCGTTSNSAMRFAIGYHRRSERSC